MDDRALRRIVVGLGGRANGAPRETGFDITAASEVMAIVAVAQDFADLRRRLGAITVGATVEGEPVTAEQLGAAGSMAALLTAALKPNLVQTLEGEPAIVHCGPFANIAHGNNSVLADRLALKLADYVVTENGFGARWIREVRRHRLPRSGIAPDAVVLVATTQALKHHGGDPDGGVAAIEAAAENPPPTCASCASSGSSPVVAVNRFPGRRLRSRSRPSFVAWRSSLRALAAEVNDGFERGGEGAVALAEAVKDAVKQPSRVEPLYRLRN
jgi:formate--tetrahydrofolate ligase